MEKGLKFESEDLNPYSPPPNFMALSPLGKIPLLQDGDFILNDSSAICAYLDAEHTTGAPMLPENPKALGKTLWIEEYADTALFSVISAGVFRPTFINQMKGLPIDHETIAKAVKEELPPVLAYLETQFTDEEWFCGDDLTVADLSVFSQLANLKHAGQLPGQSHFPKLMPHFERISARLTAAELGEAEIKYLKYMQAKIAASA